MKPKTRKLSNVEYYALHKKVYDVGPVYRVVGEQFFMVTGDFEPTQNMSEARFMLIIGMSHDILMQVDGANDAIILLRETL